MTPAGPSRELAPPWLEHPATRAWSVVVGQIDAVMAERGVDARRTVVLVPYAQLMEAGRRAWARTHPTGFAPRFESTRNWASALQPFAPGPGDLGTDMARDSLVAAALVDRVAVTGVDATLRAALVSRLVESARQLAPLAAAVPPAQRLGWADPLREVLVPGQQALRWEGMLASLSLTWASTSSYPTDVLWGDAAAPGAEADLLVLLRGFQQDPLAEALAERWAQRSLVLPFQGSFETASTARAHVCGDAEDEAQRAAACVMAQINAGRAPVALVANDRLLTRRVSAMLHGVGIPVRDETGWKLSTTHAAAVLMSLLRAADARASMDEVLDFLKQSRHWPEAVVESLEQIAREAGVSRWRAALGHPRLLTALPAGLAELLKGLNGPRPLASWLGDLSAGLRLVGEWDRLAGDPAGQQMLRVLRLGEGAAIELAGLAAAFQAPGARSRGGARLSLATFTAWVREVLEGASFAPRSEGEAAVVVLPMAQLLGRAFAATVVPGCDETHLDPSPEPPGNWTAAQRAALGLPLREHLSQAAFASWQATLSLPELDLLWRTQDRGDSVLPSAWVQSLPTSPAADPRLQRVLTEHVPPRPTPSASDVLPESLSASAYQDLRDCPYRFFAMRQLRLVEAPELEAEPDQRDMGNWLHAVLRAFHEQRGDARPGRDADRAWLDRLADEIAAAMGLATDEGGAGFLPYQAVWPALRDGYLDWLAEFESRGDRPGPRFVGAEVELRATAGPWALFGKLDRVDQQDSPEGPIPFVIDYKTEARDKTHARVKQPLEDTQLAFYAALLPDENLRAAYLSITDKRGDSAKDAPTRLIEQPEVLKARDALLEGLVRDLARVSAGSPMPALGEGRVCEHCAARGLCRKDFWEAG